MAVETKELDSLRSVEELANYQKSVESEMEQINKEFEGLPFDEDKRSRFADLKDTRVQILDRITELEARKAIVEGFAEDPRRSERLFDAREKVFNSSDARGSAKERDIYDLDQYRFDPSAPAKSRSQLRDGARRAIELFRAPTARLPFASHRSGEWQPTPNMHGDVPSNPNNEAIQGYLEYLLDHTREGDAESGQQTGAMARHLLVTGSPVYRRAFWKHAVTNDWNVLDAEEQRALRRALSLTGAQGGFAVPFALDPSIIPTSNSVVNPVRALARLATISGANTWQGVTSPAVVASYVAEGQEATDNSTTLVQPQATVQKAHVAIPFTIEISEDWPALEQEFGRLIQDSKDDLEGAQFVTGVGTTVFPQGYVTGTTATSAATTGLVVTAADVYALEAALAPRFRPRESFVANRGIYNKVRGIDTAGGAALWLYMAQGLTTQAPTPGNTGATLLGRGAWEASAMQATVVNATKIMVVGDFSYFLVVDRIGLTVELVPHIFGAANRLPTGMRALYAYWRNTSKVLSASAFVAMTGTT